MASSASPPFLRLPPEIRNLVYEYALAATSPLGFHVEDFKSGLTEKTRVKLDRDCRISCPNLLRVNRQIYGETLPILYSVNRFRFPDSLCLAIFLNTHPVAKYTMSDLRVFVLGLEEARLVATVWALIGQCINLRCLGLCFPGTRVPGYDLEEETFVSAHGALVATSLVKLEHLTLSYGDGQAKDAEPISVWEGRSPRILGLSPNIRLVYSLFDWAMLGRNYWKNAWRYEKRWTKALKFKEDLLQELCEEL